MDSEAAGHQRDAEGDCRTPGGGLQGGNLRTNDLSGRRHPVVPGWLGHQAIGVIPSCSRSGASATDRYDGPRASAVTRSRAHGPRHLLHSNGWVRVSGILAWVASSGVVQGVIIGATLAFLTTILVLDSVAKAQTTTVNGWSSIRWVGQPDNGILVRAALQKALPVVNVFEEAAYWTTGVDGARKKLSGEREYRLRFPPGHLPPNDAFWSLTATDTVGYMVSSPTGRSSVDDHSGLVTEPDGSVDILLQSQAPSGEAQNWLPTPTGRFKLMLRAYLPGPTILDGSYVVPPIIRVS